MEQQAFQPTTPSGVPPKNWLIESILVTIFCCLPFGIAGIVFATKVNTLWAAGDTAGALKASQDAGKWTKIGFFAGIAVILIYIIMVFVLGVGGFLGSSKSFHY